MDYFELPVQVEFIDYGGEKQMGIAYKDTIICMCCGGVFGTRDDGIEITQVNYSRWIDLRWWRG